MKVRNDFPILKRKIQGKDLVFLDSGATSQKPEIVLATMDNYYRQTNANIHRGVYELSVESTRMVDEARASVARLINADFEEVVFTKNTSESINLVAYSYGESNLDKGDAVVVSMLEHHSNLIPWQELCRRKGAELRVIEIDKNGSLLSRAEKKELFENGLRVITGGYENLINEQVKILAVTGVSNVLGTIVDIDVLTKLLRTRAKKAVILVDGAQMVPHMPVDVKKMGIDFLAFSGHKMLGPTGVGVLWGRKNILKVMPPFLYGGDMINEVKISGATWADLPSKFEAGTPDIAGIIGLGAAANYLWNLGMDDVRQYEEELMAYALEEMRKLEKEKIVKIYGPEKTEERGGALPFNVLDIHAHDVAQVLDSCGIAVRSGQHCAAPLITFYGEPAMVRATFYIYNTKAEVDLLIDGIRKTKKIFVQDNI